jgi:ribosomal protein L11 methylase PrmA
VKRIPGSFRDPAGQVFAVQKQIFRTINPVAGESYKTLRDTGVYSALIESGQLIAHRECSRQEAVWRDLQTNPSFLLEHPRLDVVSYPYEWTFSALRKAALFHLNLQRMLLEKNVVLSDASAYNVQFKGAQPFLIDTLSLRPYRNGEYWLAHQQFCEQFLNPLLLHAYTGILPQPWYRGNLEGIPLQDTARLMPRRSYLSFGSVSNVLLPALLQRRAMRNSKLGPDQQPRREFPKSAYASMVDRLIGLIAGLRPYEKNKSRSKTVWQDYETEAAYESDDELEKRRFISSYVSRTNPKLLLDLGANSGKYSEIACKSGASHVIAVDSDHGAAERCFARSEALNLPQTTLLVDLANESPAQGWNQNERIGFSQRFNCDGLLALAVVHHMSLGRNIPLADVVQWIMALAPQGIIEFPMPDDPQVSKLVRFKSDILAGYTLQVFESAIRKHGRIIEQTILPKSRRVLFWYQTGYREGSK